MTGLRPGDPTPTLCGDASGCLSRQMQRLMEIATRLYDSCDSEQLLLVVRIVAPLWGILILNHFIACAWCPLCVFSGSGRRCGLRTSWCQ